MRRKEQNALIVIIFIAIISVPIVISWIFTNCVMNLDFSWKCISEQTSKWFQEWLNKFSEMKFERISNKIENRQENINRNLSSTWWISAGNN